MKIVGCQGAHLIQQAQRLVVSRTRTDRRVEPRHRFQIVVEHVRMRRHDDLGRPILAQKVRRQHLDRGGRGRRPDGADDGGNMRRTAVRQVIAVDRGDHDMAQPEPGHGIGDPGGLVGGQRAGLASAHVAEAAGPGAGVAHDHHGGVALRPAFADIGAGGLFAHRHQPVLAHQRAGLVVDRMVGRLDADPVRLALDGVVRCRFAFSGWRGLRGSSITAPPLRWSITTLRAHARPLAASGQISLSKKWINPAGASSIFAPAHAAFAKNGWRVRKRPEPIRAWFR